VEIGFIDFQGLWEGWEKQFYRFSHAFHRPAFPPPASAAATFPQLFAGRNFCGFLISHQYTRSLCAASPGLT
jgi:hypothetical protein